MGGLLPLASRSYTKSRTHTAHSSCFGAGAFIGLTLMHLIPEAHISLRKVDEAFPLSFALVGVGVIFSVLVSSLWHRFLDLQISLHRATRRMISRHSFHFSIGGLNLSQQHQGRTSRDSDDSSGQTHRGHELSLLTNNSPSSSTHHPLQLSHSNSTGADDPETTLFERRGSFSLVRTESGADAPSLSSPPSYPSSRAPYALTRTRSLSNPWTSLGGSTSSGRLNLDLVEDPTAVDTEYIPDRWRASALLLETSLFCDGLIEGINLAHPFSSPQDTLSHVAVTAVMRVLTCFCLSISLISFRQDRFCRVFSCVFVFASSIPIGVLLGLVPAKYQIPKIASAMSSMSAGAILFVSVVELLRPNMLHLTLTKCVYVTSGFVLMSIVAVWDQLYK
eukprot:c10482_g1_i5.p1 GENE.c10482_g1_i5~~c10482_g1_i5.p1  ORF type:complete len:391 (-),score=70.03 c10482_g1_i5:98-1270(-)